MRWSCSSSYDGAVGGLGAGELLSPAAMRFNVTSRLPEPGSDANAVGRPRSRLDRHKNSESLLARKMPRPPVFSAPAKSTFIGLFVLSTTNGRRLRWNVIGT